jgi:hypothetical protein
MKQAAPSGLFKSIGNRSDRRESHEAAVLSVTIRAHPWLKILIQRLVTPDHF